jgi:hypothetical protein
MEGSAPELSALFAVARHAYDAMTTAGMAGTLHAEPTSPLWAAIKSGKAVNLTTALQQASPTPDH